MDNMSRTESYFFIKCGTKLKYEAVVMDLHYLLDLIAPLANYGNGKNYELLVIY